MSDSIRRSQLITPFGVGSIIDLPEDSLMLLSTDYWTVDSSTRIFDHRLARRLGVRGFNSPITKSEKNLYSSRHSDVGGVVPFTRFPHMHFCPNTGCRRLHYVDSRQSRLPRCDSEKHNKGKPKLIPVRFVVVCARGHISDFPWYDWVHSFGATTDTDCAGTVDDLKFFTASGAGLAAVGIKCTKCSKRRTLAGAGARDSLKNLGCSGLRPWLGDEEATAQACAETPMLVQRGGSNVYFPNVVTSIKIPPYSKRAHKIISTSLRILSQNHLIDGKMTNDHKAQLRMLADQYRINVDELVKAYEAHLQDLDEDDDISDSEELFRFAEYDAFKNAGSGRIGDDLRIKEEDVIHLGEDLKSFFGKLVVIEKLVETRALRSFSRLTPSSNLDNGACSISRGDVGWLPAIDATGEGIFLTLDQRKIDSWSSLKKVQERASLIASSQDKSEIYKRRSGEVIDPVFILLHTLAHALNRRLAFDCGYGSSSLKERIYSGQVGDEKMSGILIYAADASADGTLGGLLSMGSPSRFKDVLIGALEDSLICSNDPLCLESRGQGPGSLNLSACHGCVLVPETSCEESNCFLDRALLIGTAEEPALGFFNDIFIN